MNIKERVRNLNMAQFMVIAYVAVGAIVTSGVILKKVI